MRRTLGGALVFALLAAACASTPPPTPPPATPAPSAWDPRRDAIDQHAGIWAKEQPAAYEYTLDHQGPPATTRRWRYHVSGLEGGVQVQHLAGATLPDAHLGDVTVDGLFARARDALASPAFQIAFDNRHRQPDQAHLRLGGGPVGRRGRRVRRGLPDVRLPRRGRPGPGGPRDPAAALACR